MITFSLSLAALILGYVVYGRFVERVFGIDQQAVTPAVRLADGVDYVAMPGWKIFMIQFLNIAGLGPIFGAIMGAMYGPVAFLWIVFGCIFAGAVHDYLSGMLSLRHDGISIPELIGLYLGRGFKQFTRGFSLFLLLLVGAVFILGPAKILTGLTSEMTSLPTSAVENVWLILILLYYVLATLLPIDKIIGRIYPVFGAVLLIMAAGLLISIISRNAPVPELTFHSMRNLHGESARYPLYPLLFITIACGAISGFHSTQAPMMARCMTHERQGRRIFYGAMVTEGVIALIWAAAAMSFFGDTAGLNRAMTEHGNNAAWAVKEICNSWMGRVGGALALLGVVACPITSGDTAFRSARLIIADLTKFSQKPVSHRLIITLPLFVTAWLITRMNFGVIWRYFGFSNQTLAVVVLWMNSMYLIQNGKNHWISTLPAVFMTAVCATYLLIAPEGLHLSPGLSYPGGMAIALCALLIFLKKGTPHGKNVL